MDSLPAIEAQINNPQAIYSLASKDYPELVARIREGVLRASTSPELSNELQDAVKNFQNLLLFLKGQVTDDVIVELIEKIELIRSRVAGKNIDEVLQFIPEGLREEVLQVLHDPKSQRILTQELLGYSMDFLTRKLGIHMNFATLGGQNHADIGGLFQIPYNGRNLYVFWIKGHMMIANSSENALDAMSLAVKSPVFVYYLLDNKGDIIARVETQLSQFMREQLFPTEKMIEGWIKNHGTIPDGVSFTITAANSGKKVTLSKKNKESGLFIILGISQSEIGTLRASSESITLGWTYTGKSNTFTVYTSKSRVHFENQNFQATDAWSLGTLGNTLIYNDERRALGVSRWSHLGIQATNSDWRHPQTVEFRGGISLDYNQSLGPNTQGGFSIKRDGFWAPNAFPNTFDHIKSSERRYSHFLCENGVSTRVHHILGGGRSIAINLSHMQGPYSTTKTQEIQYRVNRTKFTYSNLHSTSTHPLVSPREESLLGVHHTLAPGVEGSLKASYINRGSQSQKLILGTLEFQIP